MDEKLLIRTYSVGFGDCIYVRIPDQDAFFHMLIDCGTSGRAEPILENVLENVRSMLPEVNGRRRLDLLVATHPHADHIKGFNPDWFEGIGIRHVWLSAFMKEDHPQAKGAHALQKLTDRAVRSFQARRLRVGHGLDTVLANSLCNASALEALRETLPGTSGIEPLYVSRDIADPSKERLSAEKRDEHRLQFEEGTSCLRDFREAGTCLRVLAPEWDIDGYYLGKRWSDYRSLLRAYPDVPSEVLEEGATEPAPPPMNISKRRFRLLRSRILYSALAFARTDKELKNNTSVVLLLEWCGRRLLFTGDAEWKGREVEKGYRNGCWDVMLHVSEVKEALTQPIDFLKVGHHGSVNGTPFIDEDEAEQPFLDAILPEGGEAHVVVSTLAGEHGEKKEVPYQKLMGELGRRAANACEYPEGSGVLQPPQTDQEGKTGVDWIDVMLDPASD